MGEKQYFSKLFTAEGLRLSYFKARKSTNEDSISCTHENNIGNPEEIQKAIIKIKKHMHHNLQRMNNKNSLHSELHIEEGPAFIGKKFAFSYSWF